MLFRLFGQLYLEAGKKMDCNACGGHNTVKLWSV